MEDQFLLNHVKRIQIVIIKSIILNRAKFQQKNLKNYPNKL